MSRLLKRIELSSDTPPPFTCQMTSQSVLLSLRNWFNLSSSAPLTVKIHQSGWCVSLAIYLFLYLCCVSITFVLRFAHISITFPQLVYNARVFYSCFYDSWADLIVIAEHASLLTFTIYLSLSLPLSLLSRSLNHQHTTPNSTARASTFSHTFRHAASLPQRYSLKHISPDLTNKLSIGTFKHPARL